MIGIGIITCARRLGCGTLLLASMLINLNDERRMTKVCSAGVRVRVHRDPRVCSWQFSAIITRMHTRDDIKRLTELASCAG